MVRFYETQPVQWARFRDRLQQASLLLSKRPIYCQRWHSCLALRFPFHLFRGARQGPRPSAHSGVARGGTTLPRLLLRTGPPAHAPALPGPGPAPRAGPRSPLALGAPARLCTQSRPPPEGVGTGCARAQRPGSRTAARGAGVGMAEARPSAGRCGCCPRGGCEDGAGGMSCAWRGGAVTSPQRGCRAEGRGRALACGGTRAAAPPVAAAPPASTSRLLRCSKWLGLPLPQGAVGKLPEGERTSF